MRDDYLDKFFSGDMLAAARLMSIVERGGDEAEGVLTALFPRMGRSYRIGMTGLTGAGKSTLVNQLTKHYRSKGLTVGVVAEDPTSPFSGGAILGDRVRMLDAHGDAGVFIRSIASRGSETGLSEKATELADILDAFGRDLIFLETIGVGQLETKIRYSAHTTVVVLTPDAGDDVQSLKSGLMEVGEVFVVNKADRPIAQRYSDDLRSMLDLRSPGDGWQPPVVCTVATTGDGIDELANKIDSHRTFLDANGRLEEKRFEALKNRMRRLTEEKLKELFWENEYIKKSLETALSEVVSGNKSPYQAADEIVMPIKIEKDKIEKKDKVKGRGKRKGGAR
ncbi:MAG: methylmalonyl Co-A mutase-associated GTPase MeaB [Candidatus Latescibacterota bacterium]|nr:MAG: methylmalonyl Co-A mutase-associated GTPase MeaB [Candidatus Latescibacterota bacterium]